MTDVDIARLGHYDWACWQNAIGAPTQQKAGGTAIGDLQRAGNSGGPGTWEFVSFTWASGGDPLAYTNAPGFPAGVMSRNYTEGLRPGDGWSIEISLPATNGIITFWGVTRAGGGALVVEDAGRSVVFSNSYYRAVAEWDVSIFKLKWSQAATGEVVTLKWVLNTTDSSARVGVAGVAVSEVPPRPGPRVMEKLDRGVVAIHKGGPDVYVGWRMLGTEPDSVGYNVYRDSTKVNLSPVTNSCNYLDTSGSTSSTYRVAAVVGGVEQELSAPAAVWSSYYLDVPLQRPSGGQTPDNVTYNYSPGDASVGDLDGDGDYEIVLKWEPSNKKDNSQSGYTGNVYLDAYDMDGTFLWRIDLGINVRAGPHYTQFMVYDLDLDGRAEIVCKTADGTKDGTGQVLGNASADWRNSSGYILDGPEYLSVFDGRTGAFIDTVNYVPPRGVVADWGDSYGNRVDRFLACVAYLDGEKPSVVMCRGQYTRVVLAAWDLIDGSLVQRWVFDSDAPGNSAYYGQGNHQLSVADVDDDGKDEIVYGSCTIDDDGTGLYSTGLGHGDALHVSDMDPARPGLELWMPHESGASGATYRDAATGEVIWRNYDSRDIGRGVAAHIDSAYYGYQLWSSATSSVQTVDGMVIGDRAASMMGHLVWWTGDLQREFFASANSDTQAILDKWNGSGVSRLISLYNVPTQYATWHINGTKATPCLSGDILGDWREEIVLRSSDNTTLRIFSTPDLTTKRICTLMHDPQYRLAIAWQNCGYNQPPHPSFYIGAGMDAPPRPYIVLAGASSVTTNYSVPHTWLQQFGWSNDFESVVLGDPDGDDMATWEEYWAGTNPTNSQSLLTILSIESLGMNRAVLRWQSVTNVSYDIIYRSNLVEGVWLLLEGGLRGQDSSRSVTSTVPENLQNFFGIKATRN